MFITGTPPANADELRPGYLELTEIRPTIWKVVWKAPIQSGLAANATPSLPEICTTSIPQRERSNGSVVTTLLLTCAAPLAGHEVGLAGLDFAFTDALLRIAPLGRPVQVARLTPERPSAKVMKHPVSAQVGKTYFILGMEHILTGYDHLLLVVSLMLLIVGGWQVAGTVTAFTIAHSITLVSTSLNLIGLSRQPVEICIALSIVFLAVEIVKARPDAPRLSQRIPWIVSFAFGLLHGFGFAGALAEIGLPEGEVPMALLTFNLGVEAGQLIIVAAGLLLLSGVRRFAPATLPSVRVALAYAIGTIAAFWFIERALA